MNLFVLLKIGFPLTVYFLFVIFAACFLWLAADAMSDGGAVVLIDSPNTGWSNGADLDRREWSDGLRASACGGRDRHGRHEQCARSLLVAFCELT